jgi:signal transduction histidine kinase
MYMQVGNLLADLSASNDLATVAKVSAMSGHMLLIASVGIVLLAGISLVTWLMYSHRIFGPVVPIRRQLLNLREGNYGGKVTLRRYDEFKEIAEDLNQLSSKLGAKP